MDYMLQNMVFRLLCQPLADESSDILTPRRLRTTLHLLSSCATPSDASSANLAL